MAETILNMQVDTEEDFGSDDPGSTARRWIAELQAADKYFDKWWNDCDQIVKRYRDERTDMMSREKNARRINMLWSNTQTAGPLLYSQQPVPDVSRRHKDPDPVGRTASEVLERALEYNIESIDFDSTMKQARLDYQLAARGSVWCRYVPTYGPEEMDDMTGEMFSPVADETVEVEHVHYRDFSHQAAPTWDKVGWVARRVLLTRAQCVANFGREIGAKLALGERVEGVSDEMATKFGDVFKRAIIYEIWDKEKRGVIWICRSYTTGWLKRVKDPLHLKDFFPCPKPVMGTFTTETLIPVPDYVEWGAQAMEMDILTERISLLASALKIVGVYDAAVPEIQSILDSKLENRLIPVEDWIRFADQGGLTGAVDYFPIQEVANTLVALIEARKIVKEDLYEVSGMADVIRGASDPRETARAQNIKSKWAGMRLEDRQRDFQAFVRDTLAIMGEIISEHFDPETIMMMTSYPYTIGSDPSEFAQALQLLKDDRTRGFRIDIETDSTVAPDRDEERGKRVMFLEAVTPFLEKLIPAAEKAPALAPLLGEMLMFAIRGFDTARTLESTFEDALEQLNNQPPPGPSPEEQKMMAEAKLGETKEQNRMLIEGQKREIDKGKLQIEQASLEIDRMKVEVDIKKAIGQGASPAIDEAKLAEIDIKRGQLALEGQRMQLTREELDVKKYESAAKLALEGDKLDEDVEARGEAREDADLDRAPHETVAKAAKSVSDLGSSLKDLVKTIAETNKEQASDMKSALDQMGKAMEDFAKAEAAPKELIRKNGEIVGSKTIMPGTDTVN